MAPARDADLHARDGFAGATFASFAATGFFRLERDERWWFVTPDGHPYLSWGLNHVAPGELLWPHNRAYWGETFGAEPSDEDPTFMAAYRRKVRRDLVSFGFNALGCHSPAQHYAPYRVPYVETLRFVEICHWQTPTAEAYLDVFSDAFRLHCERLAGERAGPLADDPYLLGYTLTDCPVLTYLDAAPRVTLVYGGKRRNLPMWPVVLRNLGPEAAGKRAYVDLMRDLYRDDISAFNSVYKSSFGSFADLLGAANWCTGVDPDDARRARDMAAFLACIVERYYSVAREAIARHDPHHLFFGDKLNGNTDLPDDIVAIVGRHVDALFFQWYAHYEEQAPALDRWAQLTGKPLFNGDSSFSVPSEQTPQALGPHCPDQEARARAFARYADRAFARPDFVGWHWCGWVDRWVGYGRDARHTGIQDPFGNYHVPMQRAMAGFAARLYDVALSKA